MTDSNDYDNDLLASIDWNNPTEEDLAKAELSDMLYRDFVRSSREASREASKPKPKQRPAEKPAQPKVEAPLEPSAAELKYQAEEWGHKLAAIADKFGPQSEHMKRAQEEHQQLQIALAKKQVEEHEAMVREAASISERRKARLDAEAQIAAERERAEKIAESIAELEGRPAATMYLRSREQQFSDEAIEARANEAYNLRWKLLETTTGASEATRDLPPSEQELARRQARDQVLRGSDAFTPTLTRAQEDAVR